MIINQHLLLWSGWFRSFICDSDTTLLKRTWPHVTRAAARCGLSCQYLYASWIYLHLAFEPPACNSGPEQGQCVGACFKLHPECARGHQPHTWFQSQNKNIISTQETGKWSVMTSGVIHSHGLLYLGSSHSASLCRFFFGKSRYFHRQSWLFSDSNWLCLHHFEH